MAKRVATADDFDSDSDGVNDCMVPPFSSPALVQPVCTLLSHFLLFATVLYIVSCFLFHSTLAFVALFLLNLFQSNQSFTRLYNVILYLFTRTSTSNVNDMLLKVRAF